MFCVIFFLSEGSGVRKISLSLLLRTSKTEGCSSDWSRVQPLCHCTLPHQWVPAPSLPQSGTPASLGEQPLYWFTSLNPVRISPLISNRPEFYMCNSPGLSEPLLTSQAHQNIWHSALLKNQAICFMSLMLRDFTSLNASALWKPTQSQCPEVTWKGLR